jgi:hypothetical protein
MFETELVRVVSRYSSDENMANIRIIAVLSWSLQHAINLYD